MLYLLIKFEFVWIENINSIIYWTLHPATSMSHKMVLYTIIPIEILIKKIQHTICVRLILVEITIILNLMINNKASISKKIWKHFFLWWMDLVYKFSKIHLWPVEKMIRDSINFLHWIIVKIWKTFFLIKRNNKIR